MTSFAQPALLALLAAAAPTGAAAADPVWGPVRDDARLFTSNALVQADQAIQEIREKHLFDVCIETYDEIPPERLAEYQGLRPAERNLFLVRWANERAEANKVEGLFILIYHQPPPHEQLRVRVVVRPEGQARRFGPRAVRDLQQTFERNLTTDPRTADWDEKDEALAHTLKDKALARALSTVRNQLDAAERASRWSSVVWVLAAVVAVWLLVAVVANKLRAAGRGPAELGHAAPGKGMLAAALGSMGGYWLYRSLFGPRAEPAAPPEAGEAPKGWPQDPSQHIFDAGEAPRERF